MTARRKKGDDGPRPTSGPSFWILSVLGCFFLVAGLRQMTHSKVEKPIRTVATDQVNPGQTQHAPPPFTATETTSPDRHQYFHFATNFAFGDPYAERLGKLMQQLRAEDDPMQREKLIADFLASLKAGDIPMILADLKDEKPADMVGDLSRRLMRLWAGDSPQEMAAWINSQPVGDQRQTAEEHLALVWANSQLTNAISWGQSLPGGPERNRVLTAVANEAVRMDPMVALELAVDLPASGQRDQLIQRGAMEWASSDATNAVAWAEQIPDTTLRANVLAGEAVAWANQAPESAATLAVTELPAGRLQANTVVSIVQRWAQQQPEAAATWVGQFPPGLLRSAAIDNLITQWSQKDAVGAQQWLAAHQ